MKGTPTCLSHSLNQHQDRKMSRLTLVNSFSKKKIRYEACEKKNDKDGNLLSKFLEWT